jgi:hypothetical protein
MQGNPHLATDGAGVNGAPFISLCPRGRAGRCDARRGQPDAGIHQVVSMPLRSGRALRRRSRNTRRSTRLVVSMPSMSGGALRHARDLTDRCVVPGPVSMPSMSGRALRRMPKFSLSDLRLCGSLRGPRCERTAESTQNGLAPEGGPLTCWFVCADRRHLRPFPDIPVHGLLVHLPGSVESAPPWPSMQLA